MRSYLIGVLILFFCGCDQQQPSPVPEGEKELMEHMMQLKKYYITDNNYNAQWKKYLIAFNDSCDTVTFKNNHFDLKTFGELIGNSFVSKTDTIIFHIDSDDNISLFKVVKSGEALLHTFDRYKGQIFYTFSQKASIPKNEDTLRITKELSYLINGKPIDKKNLLIELQHLKSKTLILDMDKDIAVEKLIDLLDELNKLKVKAIMTTRRK